MRQIAVSVALVALGLSSAARAGEIITIPNVLASDLSADGSVLVGNTQLIYETYRWTQATGVTPLGRPTVPVLNTGAGTPKVSADGTRVSATIMDDTDTFGTPGRWTEGLGWEEVLPPFLPDGGIVDAYAGSAWAISGDGQAVGGLYWRPDQTDGLAHGFTWTKNGGPVGLGSAGGASRVNGLNGDGSIAVGWAENPQFGNWQPTIWRGGQRLTLQESDAFAEVISITPDGATAVGDYWDTTNLINAPAIYRWDGTTYIPQVLPVLDGTIAAFGGRAVLIDISGDGSVAVGLNLFERGFFGPVVTGIVWTESTGIITANDWLASKGIIVDPNLIIVELVTISDDGLTVAGNAIDANTGLYVAFVANTIPEPTSLAIPALLGAALLRRRR